MPVSRPPSSPESFDEAVYWFRKRVPMTDAEYEKLDADAREKAFTVARVAQLDVVAQTWDALDRAISEGTSYEDFRKEMEPALTAAWGGERPWHLETIFRTNTQLAYGAGRWTELTQPAIMKARPFWKLSVIMDGRTSDICAALANTVLPADDAFWQTHNPPLHHNCRTGIIALTEQQGAGQETDKTPSTDSADGFGLAPSEQEYAPDLKEYPSPLVAIYKAG